MRVEGWQLAVGVSTAGGGARGPLKNSLAACRSRGNAAKPVARRHAMPYSGTRARRSSLKDFITVVAQKGSLLLAECPDVGLTRNRPLFENVGIQLWGNQ